MTDTKYYNVYYKSPSGVHGTLYAFISDNEDTARVDGPILLSSNSPYSPDMFEVLSVEETPEENKPR